MDLSQVLIHRLDLRMHFMIIYTYVDHVGHLLQIKFNLFFLPLITVSISTQSSQIDILVSLRLLNAKNIPWEENDAKDHRWDLFHTRAG